MIIVNELYVGGDASPLGPENPLVKRQWKWWCLSAHLPHGEYREDIMCSGSELLWYLIQSSGLVCITWSKYWPFWKHEYMHVWDTTSVSAPTWQTRIVQPKMNICRKCTHPQIIQDVVYLFKIWRNLSFHHLLTIGSSAVSGCRQNKSPNSW